MKIQYYYMSQSIVLTIISEPIISSGRYATIDSLNHYLPADKIMWINSTLYSYSLLFTLYSLLFTLYFLLFTLYSLFFWRLEFWVQ